MSAASRDFADEGDRTTPLRGAGLALMLAGALTLAGCGLDPTGPAGEECRQVDVLDVCPTDSSRVDTASG